MRDKETYKVKFWIKEKEFWEQREEIVPANSKFAHNSVGDLIHEKYKDQQIRIVSIKYHEN